jgi:DNA-directed RNA polymerase alpha subunit
MAEEKINRNRDIRIAIKSGKSYNEVARFYGITPARVREINIRMIQKQKKVPDDVDYYIWRACKVLKSDVGVRATNSLHLEGYKDVKQWAYLSSKEVFNIPGVGKKTAEVIFLAQKLYQIDQNRTLSKSQVNEAL